MSLMLLQNDAFVENVSFYRIIYNNVLIVFIYYRTKTLLCFEEILKVKIIVDLFHLFLLFNFHIIFYLP